jgi:hypothetical protein
MFAECWRTDSNGASLGAHASRERADDDWLLYCGGWQIGQVRKPGGLPTLQFSWSLTGPHTPEAPVKKSGQAVTLAEAKDQLVAAMRAWAIWAGVRTADGGGPVGSQWILTKDHQPRNLGPAYEDETDWLLISGGFVVGRVHRPAAGMQHDPHWAFLAGTGNSAPIELGGWADSIDAAKAGLLNAWQKWLEWAEL